MGPQKLHMQILFWCFLHCDVLTLQTLNSLNVCVSNYFKCKTFL